MDKLMDKPTTFTILIVDDNHNNLFTLRHLIEEHMPVNVVEADSGNHALTHVLNHKVDLIILDVQMPEMDGFEVAQGLQSLKQTRHIPIVFLTAAYKSEEFQQRGFAVGAADYLTKPIDAPQLISRIKTYLRFLEKDHEHHQELEHKVRERTADLQQARDELERRVEQRTAELHKAKRDMQLLLETAGEGICGLDAKGDICFINPAAAHMLGYEITALLKQNMHDLVHYKRHDGTLYEKTDCAIHQALTQGLSAQNETIFWTKSGTPVPISYLLRPMLIDGQPQGAVLSFRDISEQRRVQKVMQEAKEAAENANLAKSQFMANMSHELRTPLNAIIGYSEMLIEDIKDTLGQGVPPNEESWQQWLCDCESVTQAGQHLLGLVNDVLDLSKIEAGKMTLYYEEFSIVDMLKAVESTAQPLAEKNNNQLFVEPPVKDCLLQSDLVKLRQILFNLLGNACKFTKQGKINLRAECVCHNDAKQSTSSQVIFYVEDNGIGMNEAQLSKIFQPFTQADNSTTRKYGGTGLGLAISKHFIELLGGSIQVQSQPQQGTTFIIAMPTQAPIPSAEKASV